MTILPLGIVHVYGPPDSGKTLFCLQSGATPEETVFFDSDVKGKRMLKWYIDRGMVYHDLTKLMEGKTELTAFDAILRLIDGIDFKKAKVVIFDPFTEFERLFKTFISKNRQKFRIDWSPMGTIAGAQEWQVAQNYAMQVLNNHMLDRGAQLVFLTSHMKDDRLETAGGKSVRTGTVLPESQKSVVRIANLRLWLHRPPMDRIPYALVTKNMQVPFETENGVRNYSMLPPKLACVEGEQSLWDAIRRYHDNPVGFRPLLPHEIPTADEIREVTGSGGKYDLDIIKMLLADAATAQEIDPTDELIRQHLLAGNEVAATAAHFGVPLPKVLGIKESQT